ncbi:MAG: penicillin-binding protein activator [Devosia sp.]|uniref:penicillin-binding protein activator n=1 Tax=Devosia sp. TaxID=1871048 RepID=UPI0024C6C761|nr:penicillin-binding protein activator [Devosia sp.]UYN98813.1 MAG: penicillin-binding protein activator [Devosia sp.]
MAPLPRRSVLLGLAGLMAGCAPGLQLGSRTWPWDAPAGSDATGPAPMPLPTTPAERFGRGPVNVALILPLSGEPAVMQLGTALANASRLAVAFIEANPNIGENITISLRDTGTTAAGATSAAQASVAEGAKLILGPLMAEQVSAAGAVARAANVPLIGFANNGNAAGPGVYVLNVLPEAEMKRALTYIREQGFRAPAGVFPATPYGEALATAFRQQAVAIGFSPSAVYTFSDVSEAGQIVAQAKPMIDMGTIDALFMPDRASAPVFAGALQQAGAISELMQVVGSADWSNDASLASQPGLAGAIYPAVDASGLEAIRADYQARFGSPPPQMATMAYTATILANVNTLSLAPVPYDASLLTNPSGFNGRDGLFRFLSNGRSEYGLTIRKIGAGGAVSTVEGVKL